MTTTTKYAFDAFISYSHKTDGNLAPRLQEALGRIAKPWFQRRTSRIFRDETTLSATPELWPTIQRALDQSRYFILLASPEAAASYWVTQELTHWLAQNRAGEPPASQRVLIALTDGRLVWDRAAGATGDFDWNASDALPAILQGTFHAEPLYVDFTWATERKLMSFKHKPWFQNVARLAATIRGIPLDDLIGDDIRQHRIAVGSALGAGALVLALSSVAIWTWKTADVLTTEKQHQMDAERVLPQLAGQLERVRTLPTREIEIEFEPEIFFDAQPKILEVRLELDPLFTRPMSFFFASFKEGRTWPQEFSFEESPHTSFSHGRARVDAKLAWFDRVADLTQTIDATDAGTIPTFHLEFDGKDFLPGNPGIHLRQQYQIPPLQELIDKKVRFRLIEHDPVNKKATEIDTASRDLGLRVKSFHKDFGAVSSLVLYDSRQSALEKDVGAGDFLANRGPIERTVLLNLYPPIQAERTARAAKKRELARQLLETREVKTDTDRRLVARGLSQAAASATLRGDTASALNTNIDVIKLLEPLVFERDRLPMREDADLLFKAAFQPVAYFMRTKKFDRARQYLPNLSLIAEQMIASDPEEPDYLRWRAECFLFSAFAAIGTGAQKDGNIALAAYVQTQREVHHKVRNQSTRTDLTAALDQAAEIASTLGNDPATAAQWRKEASDLRQHADRSGDAQ